jgi:hypothetical protein
MNLPQKYNIEENGFAVFKQDPSSFSPKFRFVFRI